MKGDFSRPSGANGRSYAGVLHQQGRVWLDADWNDEVFARLERLRAETSDMLGACAVPEPFTGFAIESAGFGVVDDFRIRGGPGAQGRCYVDGVLCHTGGSLYSTQRQFPDAPPLPQPTISSPVGSPPSLGAMLVYLEVWQRLITSLQDPALRERALGGPDTTARLETVAQVKVVKIPDTVLGPTCATAAASLPVDGSGVLSTLPPVDQGPSDPCRIPDPESYTGRENALYRVEIHDAGDVLGAGDGNAFAVALQNDAPAGTVTLTLAVALPKGLTDAIAHRTVLIEDDTGSSERVQVQSATTIQVQSATRTTAMTALTLARGTLNAYTTARNATVRGGAAFFKWSRTNASDAFAIVGFGINGTTLTLDALGRDSAGALRSGDLVEICDDASDLGPGAGWLTYVAGEPNPDAAGGPSIALADPVPASFVRGDRHAIVRRWNGTGVASVYDSVNPAATPELDLGDGVRISFGGSDLRPGDYWQFTARAVDGTIEMLDNAPPAGIRRRRVPLGVLGWRQVQTIRRELPIRPPSPPLPLPLPQTAIGLELVSDCRSKFVPITEDATREDGIHVTGVFAVDGAGAVAQLDNDADVAVNAIFDGIIVRCDQQLDPLSVARATAQVKVELPFQLGPAAGAATTPPPATEPPTSAYQSITLAGALTSGATTDGGGAIKWTSRLDPTGLRALVARTPRGDRGLLTRVVLDGARIRSADGRLVLDGDSFGRAGADGRTLLQYPSGDGRRGGDFELWFWLTPEQRRIVGSLFVTNTIASTVTAFAATSTGDTQPRATFGQNDLVAPTGIALDRAGNVFVANSRGTLVLVAGGQASVANVDPGIFQMLVGPSTTVRPTDVAKFGGFVDPNLPPHALHRMSKSQATRSVTSVTVTRAAAGAAAVKQVTTPPIIVGPSRREFITYVNVFAAGAQPNDAPLYRLGGASTGITSPSGIAVDASGELYVANGLQPHAPGAGLGVALPHGSILRFAAGARDDTAPIAVLSGPNTNVQAPRGLAIDANGFLYVAEFATTSVLIFPPSATSATTPVILNFSKFTDPVERPFGIAVDASFIYVTGNDGSTSGEIVMIPNPGPTASGTIAVEPSTCIRIGGAGTTLQLPAGIAVDAAQNLYVVDGNKIKVFVTNGLKPGLARQGVVPVQITSSALQGSTFIAYSAS
jgi:Family of unknown function (DUF6519)